MARLPDFLIIGAQRAGTTSLYDYATTHPRILSASRKELHFFSLFYTRGISWYRKQFPIRAALSARARTGEATPYYLFHPAAPHRAAEVCPQAKLIVLLRDPVARAYSQYEHSRHQGWETLSFKDAIEAEPERLAGEAERLMSDPAYQSFAHQHQSYVARGKYAEQLSAWFDHFPRDRFLLLKSETLFSDPDTTLARVWSFLDVEAFDASPYARRNESAYPQELDPETRAHLQAHYEPHNRRLRDMLGDEFVW